jgi:hypothetical protein
MFEIRSENEVFPEKVATTCLNIFFKGVGKGSFRYCTHYHINPLITLKNPQRWNAANSNADW